MSRPYIPKVVTANDLLLGDAVYLTADDQWTRDHANAELITDEAHATIRELFAAKQKNIVVGVYLADAKPGPNGPDGAGPSIKNEKTF